MLQLQGGAAAQGQRAAHIRAPILPLWPPLVQGGLGRLVGQLAQGDAALSASLLRVVCYTASDTRAMQEIYQVCVSVHA